jgi:uncharacterized protein
VGQVLTIVGGSVRAAASSALRAGFSVHAADRFGDADLRRICSAAGVDDYPAGLAEVLRGSQSGGWLYTGALENYPALVDTLARIRPLWGNPAEVLRRVRHPQRVADALGGRGLPCPAVTFDARCLPRDGSWLRKSLRSTGGAQVSRFDQSTSVGGAAAEDYYFQQFVEGAACSAVYVGAGRKAALLGVTRQLIGAPWTGAGGFQYCGSVGPLALSGDVTEHFVQIGDVLAHEFELVGLFGVDAIINAQGVWPVEVNPRYTASVEVLERAVGLRAMELHVAACQAAELTASHAIFTRLRCGKAILFATSRLEIDADLDVPANQAETSPWPALADIPARGTTIEPGWPILTVLCEAPSEREVIDALRQQTVDVGSALTRPKDS